jgi:Ca2+-transporting ATPase
MDTFAAIALASLPPSHKVMSEKPRKVTDNIINKYMAINIFGIGGLFTIVLLFLLLIMQHANIDSMTDFLHFTYGPYKELDAYELSLFFTTFVMLQFWNLFNAKAFMTGKSAFADLKGDKVFLGVAFIVLIGQIFIVQFGGRMFNVTALRLEDWIIIIVSTSFVLWIGEAVRFFSRSKK